MSSTNLTQLVTRLPKQYLPSIVSHRGYHSKLDLLTRPLENSLDAFQTSWHAGLLLCECDVTNSKDGDIIISHDGSFERLSVFSDYVHTAKIQTLTRADLDQVTLKDGNKALYLETVLKTLTHTNSSELAPNLNVANLNYRSQLVVEIKNNADPELITTNLCNLFAIHPEYLDVVPIVMSFSLEICYLMQRKLKELFSGKTGVELGPAKRKPKVMVLTEVCKTDLRESCKNQELKDHSFAYNIAMSEDTDFDHCNNVEFIEKHLIRNKTLGFDGVELDGIYMQYQAEMLETENGKKTMKLLCEKWCVGVFFGRVDPDRFPIMEELLKMGVAYANTDLPDDVDAFYAPLTVATQ